MSAAADTAAHRDQHLRSSARRGLDMRAADSSVAQVASGQNRRSGMPASAHRAAHARWYHVTTTESTLKVAVAMRAGALREGLRSRCSWPRTQVSSLTRQLLSTVAKMPEHGYRHEVPRRRAGAPRQQLHMEAGQGRSHQVVLPLRPAHRSRNPEQERLTWRSRRHDH
jgi:hypothetical protein